MSFKVPEGGGATCWQFPKIREEVRINVPYASGELCEPLYVPLVVVLHPRGKNYRQIGAAGLFLDSFFRKLSQFRSERVKFCILHPLWFHLFTTVIDLISSAALLRCPTRIAFHRGGVHVKRMAHLIKGTAFKTGFLVCRL